MSEIILPAGGVKNVSALVRATASTVRSYWTQAEGYQKFLYVIGTLFLLNGLFHTGVLLVTGGSLAGPISWRKPIIFGFSIGVTCLSIGWLLTFLPKHRLILSARFLAT